MGLNDKINISLYFSGILTKLGVNKNCYECKIAPRIENTRSIQKGFRK